MNLESYLVTVIEGKRKARLIKPLLYLLSALFKSGAILRHIGYNKGWLRSVSVPIPVISVGNIVAGGTGKTPLIYLLAKELSSFGQVAILSRGYRSKVERENGIVNLSKGDGPLYSAEVCGDEPHWLAEKLPEAWLWVGKNRSNAAKQAQHAGAHYILLDDGMQYRKLKRNLEIVVMDAKDLFGKGYFLPRGYLRDCPKRLRYADLIVVNHVEDQEEWKRIKKELSAFSSAPVVGMRMKLEAAQELQGKKVGLFCGIGKPGHFIDVVKTAGAEITEMHIQPDHKKIPQDELYAFAVKCKAEGATHLVCTEKDAVKLNTQPLMPLPIFPLAAHLEIVAGLSEWQDFIKLIKNLHIGKDA